MLWISLAFADPCSTVPGPCSIVSTTNSPVGAVSHLKHHPDPKAERDYADPGSCINETWVLAKPGGGFETLLQVCNDGYGASGVGEDQVSVEGTVFRHRQYGGSASRWWSDRAVDLATRQLVREEVGSSYFLVEDKTVWDWQAFRGERTEGYCTPEGQDDVLETKAAVIPAVTAKGYDPAKTALGSCALAVDSATGPLVHGKPGEAGDATMKVARVGDALVVEVTDDRFVAEAKRWIHADHLEIWGSDGIPWQDCVKDGLNARQWGVLLSGQVERAHGDPPAIQAVVHGSGATRRFVITGLPELERLAVVYSDSDDGRTQERLIGTSRVVFGQGVSFGSVRPIDPEKAVCEGADALAPRRTWKPDGILLGGGEP